MESQQKGFTLIELLVVIAIIALVGTLAAVAVNSARSKQRDATRLSNIRQMQSALEDYFNESNAYPPGESLPLGDGSVSACLSLDGFSGDCTGESVVFMRIVTGTFTSGLDGLVACGTPQRSAFCYSQVSDRSNYMIEFELENALPQAGLVAGVNCATPNGIEGGQCQ
ncbi:type II secretion system protein [Patescibacteria group bacterium]